MQGTIFLHLSPQFLSPPFSPLPPLAQCPINHHPHCTSPFTTPHHTTHTTHTLHNVAQREHTPLALGSAVATLRTFKALKATFHTTSPQLTTTLHTVAQRSQK